MFARPSNNWREERAAIRSLVNGKPTALPVIMVRPPQPRLFAPPRKKLKAPMSSWDAQAAGYRGLTTLYTASERWMLENVIADMERGGIDYALVGMVDRFDNYLVEVWRKGMLWVHADGNVLSMEGEAL